MAKLLRATARLGSLRYKTMEVIAELHEPLQDSVRCKGMAVMTKLLQGRLTMKLTDMLL